MRALKKLSGSRKKEAGCDSKSLACKCECEFGGYWIGWVRQEYSYKICDGRE